MKHKMQACYISLSWKYSRDHRYSMQMQRLLKAPIVSSLPFIEVGPPTFNLADGCHMVAQNKDYISQASLQLGSYHVGKTHEPAMGAIFQIVPLEGRGFCSACPFQIDYGMWKYKSGQHEQTVHSDIAVVGVDYGCGKWTENMLAPHRDEWRVPRDYSHGKGRGQRWPE